MPKKTTSSTTKTAKAAPVKKTVAKKAAPVKKEGKLSDLRADLYVLKMKHAMHELKETHKLKAARKAVARFLTNLHNA